MSRADDGLHDGADTAKLRFPIHQDVSFLYRLRSGAAQVARGETTYMSSSEVVFTTDRVPNLGQKIEVTVDWPVLLNESCRMKLMIYGHVVRNDPSAAAVKVERYEFRTRAAGPAHAAALQHSAVA